MLIDEDARTFVVTSASKWREANPDVIDFSQVTGCMVNVEENRTEIKKENEDGTKESYDPPRYDVDYEIWVVINVNSPWFDEIKLKAHNGDIEEYNSAEYRSAEQTANDIRDES